MSKTSIVYKITPGDAWEAAVKNGVFTGAPVDLADGYIHFSTLEQTAETASKHFAGQQNLLLVAVDAEPLGDDLKWEVSRGGALFPHLYAHLSMDHVLAAKPMPLDANGVHVIPTFEDIQDG